MGGDTIEGVVLKSEHRHLLLFLSVLISIITIGHEIFLFFMHYQVVYDLDPNAHMLKVLPHAVLTFLPVLTFGCSILIMLSCMICFQSFSGIVALVVGIHTAISVMLTVTYPLQVIIYLWTHVHLYFYTYLNHRPPGGVAGVPHCACAPLNNVSASPSGYRCGCFLEGTGVRFFYFESAPTGNRTWQDMLTAVDPTVRGGNVSYTNLTQDNLVAHLTSDDQVYDGIKMLLVGLQTSVLVMVLRMPLFVFWNDVEFTEEGDDAREDLRRKMRGRKTSAVGVGADAAKREPEVHTEDAGQTREEDLPRERKLRLRMMIDLACYGFLEGTDAFALVELFSRHPMFYASWPVYSNMMLFFISISLLMVNYANLVVTFSSASLTMRRLWRLMIALTGNLPLLIFRACALGYHEGLDTVCFGCIDVLFLLKELTFVLIALTEYIMDEYISRMVEKRSHNTQAQQSQPEEAEASYGNSFLNTSLNLAHSMMSNSATKYKVKPDDQKKRRGSKGGRRTSVTPVNFDGRGGCDNRGDKETSIDFSGDTSQF